MRGLSSWSGICRDQTRVLLIGKWILNYWTTREVQELAFIEQLLIAFDAYTYQLIFTIILRDKFHYYPQHHTSKIQHAQNESPASATTNFPHCCLVAKSCPAVLQPHGLYSPPGSSDHRISRQEHWSGLPFPSPGNLPEPGMEHYNLVLAGRFFTTESPGKAHILQQFVI